MAESIETPILETISDAGKAPETRIGSARVAEELFHVWRDAAEPRKGKAAVIQGSFDGNPPFRRDKRRHAGQEWMANFNTLEAASRKDSAKSPYYDLFASTKTYFECTTEVDGKLDKIKAGRIVSEEFDKMLKRWPAFLANIWMMLDSFVAFNKGFLWWSRNDSWHFKRLEWHRIYFPDGESMDADEWEMFAMEHTFPVTKLWDNLRNEEVAKSAGWNRDMVIKAIQKAVPDFKEDDPLKIQARLNENAIGPQAISATVQAVSLFTKEFDGTWSRMMIPWFRDQERSHRGPRSPMELKDDVEGNSKTKLKDGDWLFFKTKVANDIHELLAPFFFEVHDGHINALEGLGKRMISMMQTKDRIACGIATSTILRQNIVLQAKTASAQVKTGLVQIGSGGAVIPPGYEVVTAQVFGDIQASIAVNEHFDRTIESNTGIYKPSFEKPSGNPESATAASLRFQQSTVLTNSAVNRFDIQMDLFGQELFRRAFQKSISDETDMGVKSAMALQKKLKKLGVSQEQINDIVENKSVLKVRAVGNGSPGMRRQDLQAMSGVSSFMGPRGLNNWLDDYTAAYGGQSRVGRYFPDEDRTGVPNHDDWDATRENNDMQQGALPLLVRGQDHVVHARRHIAGSVAAVNAVKQGAEPANALMFLQAAIPHIQEHAQSIQDDKKRSEITDALSKLMPLVQEVQNVAKEQAQQQQRAQELSHKQQLDQQENQAKLVERQSKAVQSLELKEAQAQQSMQIADAQAEADIRRKNAVAQAQIQAQAQSKSSDEK